MTAYTLSNSGTSVPVVAGDVVCLDPTNGYPVKATSAAMSLARAALGIVTIGGNPGAAITVADFGLVPAATTGLGAGAPAKVAVNATARCVRVPLPLGADYFVGICDTAGNVTVQTHSEVGTGPSNVFNVYLYGAVGDGVADDTAAIQATLDAVPYGAGFGFGRVFLPRGNYRITSMLHVQHPCIIEGEGVGTQLTCASHAFLWIHGIQDAPDSLVPAHRAGCFHRECAAHGRQHAAAIARPNRAHKRAALWQKV
jgi:hypothetical protein